MLVPVGRYRPRIAPGIARLEFAITVAVVGVMVAFALNRISQLQILAQQVQLETKEAQKRTLAALAQARCAIPPVAIATVPKPAASLSAPRKGVASAVELPVTACP